jgi:hypothetical protein
MMNNKSILFSVMMLISSLAFSKNWISIYEPQEWHLGNTSYNTGERIVAILDAGSIGNFEGVEIKGTITDCNGNWGYALPTIANFKLFLRFTSPESYALEQDVKTNYLTLGLRKITDSKFHLVANCPVTHRALHISFQKIIGSVNVAMGDPDLLTTEGNLVISRPTYKKYFSGYLGINKSNPIYELDVNGTIHANEIKVDMQGADFVFEEDYELRSIEELERFVKTNLHLPEIAPAKNMEENGVLQGEMNQKLLQKIEELTLYIIEQNKINKLQAKEIEVLKKDNEMLKRQLNVAKE